MHHKLSLAPLLGLAAALVVVPAQAQEDAGDKVNTVIIYGDDECPQSTPDTITVCARMDESERYRIPERLRESEDPANQAWAQRVRSFETVGAFGPMSCSNVGAGSELGCTVEFIAAAYAERAQGSEVRFGQLISQARQERLSEIDAEAAATQARVEELERAYMERLRREQAGEPAAALDPSAPPAAIYDPERQPPADLPEQPFEDENNPGPQPVDASAPAQIGENP